MLSIKQNKGENIGMSRTELAENQDKTKGLLISAGTKPGLSWLNRDRLVALTTAHVNRQVSELEFRVCRSAGLRAFRV